MKDITIEQIDEIKHNSKSVVLIWAEGCEACSQAKPFFETIEPIYDQFYFYRLQFSPEILPFYNKYVAKQPAMEPFLDEQGNKILDGNGQTLMKLKLDEQGNPIMETPISFPNFMVFVNGFIDELNEHGFVGNIGGLDKGHVEFALSRMSEQKVS